MDRPVEHPRVLPVALEDVDLRRADAQEQLSAPLLAQAFDISQNAGQEPTPFVHFIRASKYPNLKTLCEENVVTAMLLDSPETGARRGGGPRAARTGSSGGGGVFHHSRLSHTRRRSLLNVSSKTTRYPRPAIGRGVRAGGALLSGVDASRSGAAADCSGGSRAARRRRADRRAARAAVDALGIGPRQQRSETVIRLTATKKRLKDGQRVPVGAGRRSYRGCGNSRPFGQSERGDGWIGRSATLRI